MRGQSKVYLLIGIAVIIIASLTIIFVSLERKKERVEDAIQENICTFVTKQVIDYPEDIDELPLVWETIYDEKSSISIVYGDGKEIKRYAGGTIDKAVDFSPEAKRNIEASHYDTISNDDMGIIYSLNMDQSLSYIAGLLDDGYRLLRKVLTADYAEVYLSSPEEKRIRILVLSDKMLMAELDKDIVLDNMESYFN